MSPSPSRQALDIQERLYSKGIGYLFHWTYLENLPCIEQAQALCSKGTLEELDLWPCPKPGGEGPSHDLDRRHGNWGKIGLNFTPYTPMVYRRKERGCHLCFFIVKVEVATWQDVEFTDINAADNDHVQLAGLKGLDLVNFDAIRSSPRPGDIFGWRKPVQAEVLVPDQIGLDYVSRVAFVSEASCAEGERLWGSADHPTFEVAPKCFTNGYQHSAHIMFAYIERITLTGEEFDKDSTDVTYEHRTQFYRESTEYITSILRVHALSGTTIYVELEPSGEKTSKKEYPIANDYTNYISIPVNRLPDGKNRIVYYLNGVRRNQIDFEILGGEARV